jgi:F0F1-type ATP synthase assembly protein I
MHAADKMFAGIDSSPNNRPWGESINYIESLVKKKKKKEKKKKNKKKNKKKKKKKRHVDISVNFNANVLLSLPKG